MFEKYQESYQEEEYQDEPMIRPPTVASMAIQTRLISRGVYIEDQTVEMVTASMIDWLENTKEGLDYMSYLQRMDVVPANTSFKYRLLSLKGIPLKEVAPQDVEYRTSCIVEGSPISCKQILVEERDSFTCISCGVIMNCMAKEESLCSHCVEYTPESEQENIIQCAKCSSANCCWHPANSA